MKFTIFCLICLFVITAFAGCEPMVTYKDDVFDKVKTVYNYEKTKWEEEKKQKEIELAQLQKEQEQEKAEEAIKQAQEQEAEKERVKQQEAEQKIKDKQNKIEQEQNKQDRLSEIEHEVVMIVNLIRTDRGSPMLQWDDKLYEYSKQHSIDMGEVGEMFHTDMNKSYAENAWWGGGSSWEAMDIVESWMTSEKHRTWLLCPSLKHVAVGIVYSDTGMYASWTFWRKETTHSDWWYQYTPDNPPQWWY